MLIETLRNPIKQYFRWEKLIREEVILTKEELRVKRHAKNHVGVDDPTGSFVERKNSKLKRITIIVNGIRVTILRPEDWLDVVEKTYDLYSRQSIANAIRERIETKKSIEVLAGFMGISRETYIRWENEFYDDAVVFAAAAGLFQEEKNEKNKKVLHFPKK